MTGNRHFGLAGYLLLPERFIGTFLTRPFYKFIRQINTAFPSMRLLFCILLLYFAGFARPVAAQERDMPLSIRQDTAYVFNLIAQGDKLRKQSPDSAMGLYGQALAISRRLESNKGISESLLGMSICLFKNGQYLRSKAALYEARSYCWLALKEDKTLAARYYNNLGNVFFVQGYRDSAVRYYYQALAEINLRNIRDTFLLMSVFGNAGAFLAYDIQSGQALYYLKLSNTWARQLKDPEMLARTDFNLGIAFHNLRKYDTALACYRRSIETTRSFSKNKGDLQTAYYFMGITYGQMGDLNQARLYFDSSVDADPEKALQNSAIQKNLGDIHMVSEDYRKAIAYYKKSIELSEQQGTYRNNFDAYEGLAEGYYKTGDTAAYRLQKRYSDLRDSFMNETQIRSVNQQEVHYRTLEKDRDIAQKQLLILKQQSRLKQKNFWIGVIIAGIVLLAALVFFIFRSYRRKQQIAILSLRQSQLKVIMKGEETERRRIARELHDGIGSIISAAKLHLNHTDEDMPVEREAYRTGLRLLDDAYDELRRTARNLIPEQLLGKGLASAVQAYCERVSRPGVLDIYFLSFGSEPALPSEKALSLYRMVQELVHNAHKHGQASRVTVQISYQDSQIYISVEDNGTGLLESGMESPDEHENTGTGLRNIRERIMLMGGSIDTDSRPGMGLTIYIEVGVE